MRYCAECQPPKEETRQQQYLSQQWMNLSQHDYMRSSSLTSNSMTPASPKLFHNMVPKQAVDIVDMANSVDHLSRSYKKTIRIGHIKYFWVKASDVTQTYIFSNVEIDGVLVWGKQDIGTEINAMPLNVYMTSWIMKLQGKLQLRPCGDIKVIGYSKQSVMIVGKISVYLYPCQCNQKVHLLHDWSNWHKGYSWIKLLQSLQSW